MVTSDKQTQANRQNALKSTGPKTPEGKSAVRHNALKHGLLAQAVLLPDEDEAAFEELAERLRDELRPAGELEGLLVDRIIAAQWRLRRLGRVEAGIFVWDQRQVEAAEERGTRHDAAASSLAEALFPSFGEPPPPHAPEPPEDLSEAERANARQEAVTAALGRTFTRDSSEANAFSKLSRYEAAIERSLYRALHELQRVQAARGGTGGGRVPPPPAIDVDVSG